MIYQIPTNRESLAGNKKPSFRLFLEVFFGGSSLNSYYFLTLELKNSLLKQNKTIEMKKFYLELIVVVLTTFVMGQGCNTTRNSAKDQAGLSQTVWQLIEIEGSDFENLTKVWLKFENDDEKKVSGYAGCNRFFGVYEISDNNLKFGNLASTKMFCPEMELESSFLKRLADVDRFEVSDSKLSLFSEKEKILVFQPPTIDD